MDAAHEGRRAAAGRPASPVPARQTIAVGETYDFEVARAARPGQLWVEVEAQLGSGRRRDRSSSGELRYQMARQVRRIDRIRSPRSVDRRRDATVTARHEGMRAAVLERDAGSGDEVRHRARDQHFAEGGDR